MRIRKYAFLDDNSDIFIMWFKFFKTICRLYPAKMMPVYVFCFRWKDCYASLRIAKIEFNGEKKKRKAESPHSFLHHLNCNMEGPLLYGFDSHPCPSLPRNFENDLFIALVSFIYCWILWKVRRNQLCLQWCYCVSYITMSKQLRSPGERSPRLNYLWLKWSRQNKSPNIYFVY